MGYAHFQGADQWSSAKILAISVMIAGVLQCLVLWAACRAKRLAVSVTRPRFNRDMRRLFSLMGPGVVSAGIQQVNLLVGARAKANGFPLVIALINDPAMTSLMAPLGIDAFINPRATTVSSILRHIRHGRVASLLCAVTATISRWFRSTTSQQL